MKCCYNGNGNSLFSMNTGSKTRRKWCNLQQLDVGVGRGRENLLTTKAGIRAGYKISFIGGFKIRLHKLLSGVQHTLFQPQFRGMGCMISGGSCQPYISMIPELWFFFAIFFFQQPLSQMTEDGRQSLMAIAQHGKHKKKRF